MILDLIVSMLLGVVLTTGAAVTGNLKPLCEQGLKGKYVPTSPSAGVEQCPGGHWSNLVARPK